MSDASGYLSLEAAQQRLGVGRRVFSRLLKDGQLPTYVDIFDTRRRMVAVADVERVERERVKRQEAA